MEERFSGRSKLSLVSSPDPRQPLPFSPGEEKSPHPGSMKKPRPSPQSLKRSGKSKSKIPPLSPPSPPSKITPLRVLDQSFTRSSPTRPSSFRPEKFPPDSPRDDRSFPRNPSPPPIAPLPPVGVRRVPRRRPIHPLILATRYLIFGVGMAVISGTVLSILSSISQANLPTSTPSAIEIAEGEINPDKNFPNPTSFSLKFNQEISDLKQSLQNLTQEIPQANPGIFLVDLETGNYVNSQGNLAFPSASTIKLPILFAFFQAVDEGRVQLNQLLTLKSEQIVGGAGDLQYQTPGKEFTALEVVKKMIIISDNTATNMILELLGGKDRLNQQFKLWGLGETLINNPLPDLQGTNKTSGKDLVTLMAKIAQGDSISLKSRDWMLYIMRQTKNDTLLPKGLGSNQAIIAHKTGYINGLLGDAGIIDLPNGKRYLLAVLVQYSGSKKRIEKLIREISHQVYESLSQAPQKESLSPQEPASIPLPTNSIEKNGKKEGPKKSL